MAAVTADNALNFIRASDLRVLIMAQLPRDLQSKVTVSIVSDAYGCGGKAHFRAANGEWDTRLLTDTIEGVPIACKLPGWFIDHLCLVAG